MTPACFAAQWLSSNRRNVGCPHHGDIPIVQSGGQDSLPEGGGHWSEFPETEAGLESRSQTFWVSAITISILGAYYQSRTKYSGSQVGRDALCVTLNKAPNFQRSNSSDTSFCSLFLPGISLPST